MEDLLGDVVAWLAQPDRWSWTRPRGVPYRTVQHLGYTLASMAITVLVAAPPAMWLAHQRRAQALASAVVNFGRAIPSFGLVVLFWLLAARTDAVGGAFWPLVGALVALALPPVFTNTYTAVREVDAATVEAARGTGHREREILTQIELPLASPVILAGIRVATVQVMATVAIGAIVTSGGGGLGRFIIDGFARGASGHAEVLVGAVLVAVLTLAAEGAFALLQRRVHPRGTSAERGGGPGARAGRGLDDLRVAGRTGAAG